MIFQALAHAHAHVSFRFLGGTEYRINLSAANAVKEITVVDQKNWTGIDEVGTVLAHFTLEVEPVLRARVRLACRLVHCRFSVDYADSQTTSLNRAVADAVRHLMLVHNIEPSWSAHFIRDSY
jgi:hypothetical protein